MSSYCAIFIPTYKRPHKIVPLIENLYEVTKSQFKIYFIVEKNDQETIDAVKQVKENMIINTGPPTYASCINVAYTHTTEPFFFLGADDIKFRNNWLKEALECMSDKKIGVVGTLDPLHPSPDHSGHCLVRRSYIENHSGCMDFPNVVLYPYRHGFTDWEFIGVAKARKTYVYCENSIVEHIHPGWRYSGVVDERSPLFDETYAKGNKHHYLDTRLLIKRSNQWLSFIENKSKVDKYKETFIYIQSSHFLSLLTQLNSHFLTLPFLPEWFKKGLEFQFVILDKLIYGLISAYRFVYGEK